MICLTTTASTVSDALRQVEENRGYIDLVELRLDKLEPQQLDEASAFPEACQLPVIATFRRKVDGGLCVLSNKTRISLLRKVVLAGKFAYVDLEQDLKKSDFKVKDEKTAAKVDFEEELHEKGVRIIRSLHDFEKVPAGLYALVEKIARKGDIPKVAVTPNTIVDVVTLFRMEEELVDVKDKIVIGMGDYGVCTRILYHRLGSMLTFACAEGDAVAPGQLSAKKLKMLYRADKVDGKTAIYGIIGNPVLHSCSPEIHNPGFAGIHYNAIYVPFLVDKIRSFFRLAEMIHIHGFSVTVPYKREVLPYLGKVTREVLQIGACNTVTRIQGMWKGTNTDYYGFIAPINDLLKEGKVKKALVIGAGGAARSVVWALVNHGVKVTVLNRTIERARELAKESMSAFDSLDHVASYSGKVDLVVQTTSVGMAPHSDADPAPALQFTGNEIVYDLIYSPEHTRFLDRAKASGCTVYNGKRMLLEQGLLQFEAFTGYHYPYWIKPSI
ncbi:MAG: shikimate dehydrogenase [Spirochaetia bacterium]|jgi:3-dehydroquinate dehydratase/shikimate dehydrogenase|nr:shikimate dehydrogenase [Spirochaetia bacterium]